MENHLKKLRKEKGFTQEELASKLGISRRGYQKWENAEEFKIPSNKVEDLAQALEVTVGYLLGYSEVEEKIMSKVTEEFKKKIDFARNNDITEIINSGWQNENLGNYYNDLEEVMIYIRAKKSFSKSEIRELERLNSNNLILIDYLFEQRLYLSEILRKNN